LTVVLYLALLVVPRLLRREKWLRTHPNEALDSKVVLILGVKVLGSWKDRDTLLDRYEFGEIWISEANQSISQQVVVDWAQSSGLKVVSLENAFKPLSV